jgi:hypothetical protein
MCVGDQYIELPWINRTGKVIHTYEIVAPGIGGGLTPGVRSAQ